MDLAFLIILSAIVATPFALWAVLYWMMRSDPLEPHESGVPLTEDEAAELKRQQDTTSDRGTS